MKGLLAWMRNRLKIDPFNPGIASVLVEPFYLARASLSEWVQKVAPLFNGRLLDVGCGQKPYLKFFKVTEYVGLEIDTEENRRTKKADVYYDGGRFPFNDAAFDGIVCNQVLEHVFNPHDFLSELNRVLRKDGTLLIAAPFIWDEHEQPFDFGRYTSFGLAYMLKQHGFHVQQSAKLTAGIFALAQLINAYLYKVSIRMGRFMYLLTMVFLMAPLNCMALILGLLMPGDDDLYIVNAVIAKKIANV